MRPENLLFPLRLAILTPAAGLLLGSAYFAYHALLEALAARQNPLEEALTQPVGAVDLGLLSAVFLIFGLGLFELFVRKLDLPMENALQVESLTQKGKLG